jgi:hypothetical protein
MHSLKEGGTAARGCSLSSGSRWMGYILPHGLKAQYVQVLIFPLFPAVILGFYFWSDKLKSYKIK